jgi:hypothetical protein
LLQCYGKWNKSYFRKLLIFTRFQYKALKKAKLISNLAIIISIKLHRFNPNFDKKEREHGQRGNPVGSQLCRQLRVLLEGN